MRHARTVGWFLYIAIVGGVGYPVVTILYAVLDYRRTDSK